MRLVQGVGVNDTKGETKDVLGKHTKSYALWLDVLKRCYNEKNLSKFPAYIDCSISDDWKHFSKFKKDVEEMVGFGDNEWRFDKDILVKGNRVYSKDTCCFVPIEINATFIKRKNNRGDFPIGVTERNGRFVSRVSMNNQRYSCGSFDNPLDAYNEYKLVKEQHIKGLANKWKDMLDRRVYNSMMSYNVDIND